MTKSKNWWVVFKNAFQGVIYAFQTQRNFKIHLFLSFLVVFLAIWLDISKTEFLFLTLAIIFGLTVEMANTAFEKTVDLVIEKYHPQAKIAKDVSAGMMLIASFGLALMGLLILLPPLWQKLGF
ncbi:diacylglycerol kinase [Candidatus Shapirobacteria bacterium CG10_big_fil_rev_8_21_14_0_10_38_14]|uniref:Diacylglycerol kinase n=1 Tax=Candidatus Shapirobacteria bacterium CG10_big_fil_rev_8_21_14_0_10_38_14 TaxID=1974483 RepID=A0A2M8L559_9BACT|nr:MAG: diacylglycerol kinase [Candidatus Shapirobacteria bacterium CG10_big_fil_rev_8_21_14_0_10_38_14]